MEERIDTIIELIGSLEKKQTIALIYKNGFRTFRYSFADLSRLSRSCATLLQKNGVRAGDRVAIWGENRPEWIFAFLGALWCGAVPVPLDIQALPEAVERILKHAEAKLIVKSNLRSVFLKEWPTIVMDNLEFEVANLPEAPAHQAHAEDMAEIVYTSGTTGDPKGVVLTHKNIITDIRGVITHLNISERDSLLTLLPLSHMFGQTGGLLAPLFAGVQIVIPPGITANSILTTLREERITIMLVVPRILQGMRFSSQARLEQLSAFMRLFARYGMRRRFGSSFRFFVSGGAALDAATETFWRDAGFSLLQGYGLTECSPVLTLSGEADATLGSVGTPIEGVELRLATDGEIEARGNNIFGGYYREPEKTAAVFRDGWFLTGDFGTCDEHGRLCIRGRKKETIVTSAGVNVYPDDVEAVLNVLPGVKESCVVGIPQAGSENVHAVIIPSRNNVVLADIVAAANQHLNSSQEIKSISLWSGTEFPKTTTLKIKRGLVRDTLLKQEHSPSAKAPEAADKLKIILSKVTGIPATEIADTDKLASDLKLDSIGRIELASLITQEYFFDFDEEHINERTTVADLSKVVGARMRVASRFSFPRWPHYRFMAVVRLLGMELVNANIARLFARIKIHGREHLSGVHGPVIFVANHVSYGDHPMIFRALPARFKYMFAAPAYAEFFYLPKGAPLMMRFWKSFTYYWAVATMGLFPTSVAESSKRALEHAGSIIDSGQSILIFPEAERTESADMLPFKKGTALLVKNLRVPVVPIGHYGLEYVFPRGAALPKFGTVTVNIGKPIVFGTESVEEITERLRSEIERLRKQ